jgi:hypothetical protein
VIEQPSSANTLGIGGCGINDFEEISMRTKGEDLNPARETGYVSTRSLPLQPDAFPHSPC